MAEETMFEQATDQQPEQKIEPLTLTVDAQYNEFIEQYVGEGKKYSNVGELAKAYANADRHIVELNSDLTKFKNENTFVKDLLMTNLLNDPNEIKEPVTPPNEQQPPAQPPEAPTPPAEEGVDLSKKIEDALIQREAAQRRKVNATNTEKVMLEQFENREAAIEAVETRAKQLNVEPTFISNLAFDSPTAFFELMGINPDATPRNTDTPAPRSDVNPQRLADANPRIKEGTYRFYSELRKSDPSKYRSAEVQNQMMKDAEANPNFYT